MPRRRISSIVLKNLTDLALAEAYSVRDAQYILARRGLPAPSIAYIWKFFKRVRAKRRR